MNVDSEQTLEEIRKALTRVVRGGLVPYNVVDEGWPLLELRVVRSRVKSRRNASESEEAAAYTEALTTVLKEAVKSDMMPRRSRRLLRAVLPLKSEYLGTSLEKRRVTAGKEMREGKSVKPGTIRTYYEPQALDRLAEVLLEMERAFRDKA